MELKGIRPTLLKKAERLIEENRIELDLDSDTNLYFKCTLPSEELIVMYMGMAKRWSCTCKYGSLWGKGKYCSHIVAAILKVTR